MNILKLVSRNLFSRKGRFVFTLLGITIGMAAFVALLSLGSNMQSEVRQSAHSLGANLIITPENFCVYNQVSILTGDAVSELLHYDTFEKIADIDGLTVIPHLTQRAKVNDVSAVVVGILPEQTKAFRSWEMNDGEYFTSQNENAIVVGRGQANILGLQVGDIIPIRGEDFTIKGILNTTRSNDDTILFMPISVIQRLYEKEGYVSYMSAKVDDMEKVEYYKAAIVDVASVNVATDEQILSSVLSIIGSVNVTLQLVAGVALIAAAFGIINTMMTAIYERRREIGIMRAMGSKASTIFKIFLLESGLYGLLGGVIGVIVGIAVSVFAAPIIQGDALLKGMEAGANINVMLVVTAIGFSLMISIVSGLYPAWKAAKLTPVEAINN